MATTRQRRRGIRRALSTVTVLVLAALLGTVVGPGLALVLPRPGAPVSAGAAGSPVPAAPGPAVGYVRDGPELVPSPTPPTVRGPVLPVVHPPRTTTSLVTASMRIALQKRLDGIRVKYGIPGVSVAILFADGGAWVGTSGSADLAERTPVTPSTAFAVASITKTFTAALVLTLVEDGAVGLDHPVRRYLPGLDIDRRITVRQLLDHTSGLRDYFFHPRIDRALLSRPERRWDSARSLRYVGKPYFKPGRGWHYSNTNYLILGMLAEAVTGDPLAVALRERFFEPLALRHTYEQTTEEPRGAVAHGYRFERGAPDATAIDLSDGTSMMPFTSVVTAAAGAGAVASSAIDLARWARALFGGEVLSDDSLRAMLDDATRTDRYKPPVRYGLGVQFVDVGGRPAIGHSGRLLGFRSVVRWLPAERMAVAVVTNQSRTDPAIIARALSKIALRLPVDCDCGQRR